MNKTQANSSGDWDLKQFLKKVPKCELHLHIEGTFEPELIFQIAKRNGMKTRYENVEDLRKAYQFSNLQDFLDLYYLGAQVLIKEEDFYDLTTSYLKKCVQDNVVHTEIFVDPQTHTSRGVSMKTVINGVHKAMEDAKQKWGISSYLIVCFLRHLDEESALATYEQAKQFKDKIVGFGLDSSEVGNPPKKFARVYQKVRNDGFKAVAHAGEEGQPSYVWQALQVLKVKRIDHGIRSLEDNKLVQYLAQNKVPLTVCPLSNLKLKVVQRLEDHPLKKMLQKGLMVSINSDDPAYFGGYANQNYFQTAKALGLTKKQIIEIAKNSFISSFLPENTKQQWIQKLQKIIMEKNI